MEKRSPTRQNLLGLKAQLDTMKAGVELLSGRRKALTREFFGLVGQCLENRDELTEMLAQAQKKLQIVRALDSEGLKSLTNASTRDLSLDIELTSIWGITVPEIHEKPVVRGLEARGVSFLGERVGSLEAAKAFETIVARLVKMASKEVKLQRVGDMIRSDTRKINAIDEFILPEMASHIKAMERILEEREREEVFRLKRYKRKRT